MNYSKAREALIWNFRLDYDPVGIKYISEDSDKEGLTVTHRAKSKMTFCQLLSASRSSRHALYMEPGKLSCKNAEPVFGFRELDKERDTKNHLKYLVDSDLAWKASQEKQKLELGSCKGVYMAPLDMFDDQGIDPDVVFMMVVPYQAFHILNDYMGGSGKASLNFFMAPNSAVCAGSVYSYNMKTANMTTMCAGSKTSGRTDMNYMNLFIPGDEILSTVSQLENRVDKTGGPSLLGKGGQPWPGLDTCGGCPMVRFEKV